MSARLRLQCPCGRNLADALNPAGSTWLRIHPRLGVDRELVWQPAAFQGTWRCRCRCGRVHKVRVDRIAAVYARVFGTGRRSPAEVIHVVIGVDV
jgi:hypothetical protein